MYCQTCGARNHEEQEYCRYCHQKLMVVSGPMAVDEQEAYDSNPEEQFSFDEHLLERISILEEVVKRTAETVRHSLSALYRLEQQILVNQTGVTTLRDLLEEKRLISHEEWSGLWEVRMDYQLLALEKRERFAGVKEEIAALYGGDEPEAFQELLDEAEYALLAFDVEEAVRALDKAHQLDRANYELAFFLGEIFFNEGLGDVALRYFDRVLAAKSDHFESLVYGGVLAHEQRNLRRAEDLLKRAVAVYPDAFLPAFSLGTIYAAHGRLSEAAALLERAVVIDPLPQAHYLLGSCFYEMGKTGGAIRHLREAVRTDPAFAEAYHLLGLSYLDRRWFKKATEAFKRAQLLHPKKLHYLELMPLLRTDAAAELAVPPEAVTGEALEWVRRAEEGLARGERREALGAYRRALSQDPDNPTLLVAYAMACLELGRAQEIEGLVDKALELEPGERLKTTAYATLLEALRYQGKYREGNRLGRRLLGEPGSDLAKTVAYFELALNLAEIEEDLDEALDYARRALELAPDEIRQFPLAALGWVHYKRREFEQAVDCLSRSQELCPTSRTLTHLGMALLAAGKRDDARRALAEAHDLEGEMVGERVLESLKDGTRRLQVAPSP